MSGDNSGAKSEKGEGAEAPKVLVPYADHARPPLDTVGGRVEIEEDVGKGGVEPERGGDVRDLRREVGGEGRILGKGGCGGRGEGEGVVVNERGPGGLSEDGVCKREW